MDAHLGILQRRLREMRVSGGTSNSIADQQEEGATVSHKVAQPAQAIASLADTPAVAFVYPVSASPSSLLPPEGEKRPVHRPRGTPPMRRQDRRQHMCYCSGCSQKAEKI